MMDSASLLSSPATWMVAALSVAYLLFKYTTLGHTYFSDQGIPGPKPVPLLGTLFWGIWKVNLPRFDRELVKKYGKVLGLFNGPTPTLMVTDVGIIESVFVKDFDHFTNRRDMKFSSGILRMMLFLMKNQEWRDVRSSVAPVFTAEQMEKMSGTIETCANLLIAKFETIAHDEGRIDAKMQLGAFTMSVIARCVFGMTIDNSGEQDDPFMKNAKGIFTSSSAKSPCILIPLIFPKIMSLLAERFVRTKQFDFFAGMLANMIKERDQTAEKFNDFVDVTRELVSAHTKEVDGEAVPMWTKEEVDEIVIAQSTLFLVAGFDTTATTLTNTIFLLARHPEVQEKLYGEVADKLEQHRAIDHDMVCDIPYLDHVLREVMRMYPAITRVERLCNKDVTYNGMHIKKGVLVTVPIYALHYDEDYYPDPEKFDPDRWDSANVNPNAWMPFGLGPRNCIGMRFAMEEMKIVVCALLNKFRFFPVEETPDTIQLEDGLLEMIQLGSAIVGIELRN